MTIVRSPTHFKIRSLHFFDLTTNLSNTMKRRGFTYLELLVSIAIISILAAASLYFFIGAQADSRDARRKSDLAQLQLALEAYKADYNTYPASSLTALTFYNYIEKIPTDPWKF